MQSKKRLKAKIKKKKRSSMKDLEILVYHENLVTISCFNTFFNLQFL